MTGNSSPAESLVDIRSKLDYEKLGSERFIRRPGLDKFRRNPIFPVNTLQIIRGVIAAQREGAFSKY